MAIAYQAEEMDAPQRRLLSAQLHARPPEELGENVRAIHFTVGGGASNDDTDTDRIKSLCRDYGIKEPASDLDQLSAECDNFRLKWERHTEFTTYTFFYPRGDKKPFSDPPMSLVPQGWFEAIKHQVMVAVYVELVQNQEELPDAVEITSVLSGGSLAGSRVSGGNAALWSDYLIHKDGFTRVLIHDSGLGGRQRGRLLQRIIEIETYGMMALLAYPLARDLGAKMAQIDTELATLASQVAKSRVGDNEKPILYELQALSARLEDIGARTNYRFSAAQAYYELVQRRTLELREQRIPGLQTTSEFIDRRLAPGMRTCQSVQDRIEKLSTRAARLSNLLRTQIDIALETQNRDLLHSMDERSKQQLRLQETVEGLSVVVLSYYSVGLISYGLKSLKSAGLPVPVELVTGISIPLVFLAVWGGVKIMRNRIMKHKPH
ncbi:MAG: DUF3422 domain-containing protein [Gammaproteobacteria bacterium]|nr:DUF3422 domain-containing protein [Gammaproteobacteria bacterium]